MSDSHTFDPPHDAPGRPQWAMLARMAGMAVAAGAIMLAANAGKSRPASDRTDPSLADLKDFDGVSLSGPDQVVVTRGEAFSVQVDGDARAIARLRFEVRKGTLRITRDTHGEDGSQVRDIAAVVRITMPVLRRVDVAGSGILHAQHMAGEIVEASLAGMGEVTIDLVEARQARLSMAGSGAIVAAGAVDKVAVSIAGSGDIEVGKLLARTAEISIAGSGDAYVHASEHAEVSIVGSGDAMIRGTDKCRVSRVGSGDVHCAA